MKWSETTAAIAPALVGFQADCPNIPRSSTTKGSDRSSYKYDYADLAEVRKVAKPHLDKHGLTFVAGSEMAGVGDAAYLAVTVRVLHRSGEWVEQTIPMSPDNGSPQSVGSAQTYGIRYCVMALLGLAADGEDDDGKGAQPKGDGAAPRFKAPSNSPPPAAGGAPMQTFGPVFLSRLADKLKSIGKTHAELRAVMLDAGIDRSLCPSDDPATWSNTLQDRIKRWVDTNVAKTTATKEQS